MELQRVFGRMDWHGALEALSYMDWPGREQSTKVSYCRKSVSQTVLFIRAGWRGRDFRPTSRLPLQNLVMGRTFRRPGLGTHNISNPHYHQPAVHYSEVAIAARRQFIFLWTMCSLSPRLLAFFNFLKLIQFQQ